MRSGDDFDDMDFLHTIELLKTWEDVVPNETDVRRAETVITQRMRSRNGASDTVSGLLFQAVFILVALLLVSCTGLLPSAALYLAVLQTPGAGSFLAGAWWIIPVVLMVLTVPLLLIIQPINAR